MWVTAWIISFLVVPYALWVRLGRRTRFYHAAQVCYIMEGTLVCRDISTTNRVAMLDLDIFQKAVLFWSMLKVMVKTPYLELPGKLGKEIISRFHHATRSKRSGVPGDKRFYWAVLTSEAYSVPYGESHWQLLFYYLGFGRSLNKEPLMRILTTLIVAEEDLETIARDPDNFLEETKVESVQGVSRLVALVKCAERFMYERSGSFQTDRWFRRIEVIIPQAREFPDGKPVDWTRDDCRGFRKAAGL